MRRTPHAVFRRTAGAFLAGLGAAFGLLAPSGAAAEKKPPAPAAAGVPDPRKLIAPGYQTLTTKRYRILHKDPEDAKRIGGYLESLHEAFFKFCEGSLPAKMPGKPLEAILVDTEKEYELLESKVAKLGKVQSSGFYETGTRTLLLRKPSPMVAVHEATHQLFHQAGLQSDYSETWLDEGLAEYFGGGCQDGKVVPGRANYLQLLTFRMAKEQGRLHSLETVLKWGSEDYMVTNKAFSNDQIGIAYAQFWALNHFLLEGEGGKNRKGFFEFLKESKIENNIKEPGAVKVTAKSKKELEKKIEKAQAKAKANVDAQKGKLDDKRLARFKELFGGDLGAFQKKMEEFLVSIPIERDDVVDQLKKRGPAPPPDPGSPPRGVPAKKK